uniref:Alpha-carbonic anhydrase domain-containing protein n=1 Tax=Steinernema glaseri TaxID=37863 RepID=A0A1I7Y0N2_9BILA
MFILFAAAAFSARSLSGCPSASCASDEPRSAPVRRPLCPPPGLRKGAALRGGQLLPLDLRQRPVRRVSTSSVTQKESDIYLPWKYIQRLQPAWSRWFYWPGYGSPWWHIQSLCILCNQCEKDYGPDFWGLVDKHWTLCSKGKLQSPISIESARLAFDPNLRPVLFDEVTVLSRLQNLGQIPVVSVESADFRWPSPNASAGPLRPYRYRLHHIQFHFGRDGKMGSEHALDSNRFPMEIQLVAINTDLYANYSAASKAPHGLAGISVMVELGARTNEELLKVTVATASIPFKGMEVDLMDLKPWKLLPETTEYVTYEGSTTSPGCHETVTWIVFNRPIYISPAHVSETDHCLQRVSMSAAASMEQSTTDTYTRSRAPFHLAQRTAAAGTEPKDLEDEHQSQTEELRREVPRPQGHGRLLQQAEKHHDPREQSPTR